MLCCRQLKSVLMDSCGYKTKCMKANASGNQRVSIYQHTQYPWPCAYATRRYSSMSIADRAKWLGARFVF